MYHRRVSELVSASGAVSGLWPAVCVSEMVHSRAAHLLLQAVTNDYVPAGQDQHNGGDAQDIISVSAGSASQEHYWREAAASVLQRPKSTTGRRLQQ